MDSENAVKSVGSNGARRNSAKKPHVSAKISSTNPKAIINNKSYNELYNYYCVDSDDASDIALSRANSKLDNGLAKNRRSRPSAGEVQKKVMPDGRNIELQLFSNMDNSDDNDDHTEPESDLIEENGLLDDTVDSDNNVEVDDDSTFVLPQTKLQRERSVKFSRKSNTTFSSELDTKFLSLSPLKRSLFLIWRKRLRFLAILLAVFIVSSMYFFTTSAKSDSVVLSLNYEQSSKGLYPNSIRFNITEVKSNEVMTRAIKYAGLEKVITPSELAKSITLEPLATSSVNLNTNYIATSYNIIYTLDKRIKNISARDMCTLICKAYSDVFHEYYTENHSILDFTVDGASSSEYLVLAQKYETKANMLSRYLEMRANSAKAYSDETTGETFKSLRKRVSNLIDYDIANFKSYILESGISKDQPHYNSVLLYKNKMLTLDYKKNMSSYNSNRAGITMYDAAMSAVVMIPTEYQVSGKTDYYMSRTNSEYDFLADSAKWNLKDATDVQAKISTNNDIVTKLKSSKPTSAEIKKANSLITSMENALKKLSADIDKTDKAYIHNKTNDYLTFKQSSVSIKSRFGVKYSLIISAGVLLLLCANVYLTQKRKENCD